MGMMRLDAVEISGFKSFCDRQQVSFQGGVTGIVGPNGCGKSNISDAISWVLGEQSAKSLRATGMEDVIFAGSQSRQPLAMAEVNLRVSGLNGNSPDGNPEATVTRRLYRNGDSEYLINGNVCRLRDVHELFMDTGLGAKAYSIIEQGKIGLILSSKPADRRSLIEEAAGITKYKARRRQTQLKLDAAQQNLLRVNDIVNEVEKQLESLKRQAGKARRYRALKEEIQGWERILFGRRFLDLEEQQRILVSRFEGEGDRERASAVSLETEEAQMEARRVVLYEREAELLAVRESLNELTISVDRQQSRIVYCKEQIAEAEVRAAEARTEHAQLDSRIGPLGEQLDARRAEETQGRTDLAAAQSEATDADAGVAASATRQGECEAQLDRARDKQMGVMGRIASLENSRQSVSGNAERASATLLKLGGEIDELGRERAGVDTRHAEAKAKEQAAEALLATLRLEREQAESTAADAQARGVALAGEAETLESERAGISGRLSTLEEMIATHAAFDEGVRALLSASDSGIGVIAVVADLVETDKAHERAVEAFMGDRLQALLVPDADHAIQGIRHLEASSAGRATFLSVADARGSIDCDCLKDVASREPKVKALVSDLYRVAGPHADRIRASLPNGLLFETLADARDVSSRNHGIPCVTLAGETLRGSMVEGGRGVKGLLSPRREVRELLARREEVEVRLRELREQHANETARAKAATETARELAARIHAAEKELVAIRHDLHVALEEVKRLDRKAGVLDTERRQAEGERGAAAVKLGEIEEALKAAEADRNAGQDQLAALQQQLVQARVEADRAQSRSAEARSLLAGLRERVAAMEAECRRLGQDREELVIRIESARARGEEMEKRRAELSQERDECERLLSEALTGRDRVVGQVSVAEEHVRELKAELESREQSIRERRREREVLKDAISELEVARARVGSDLDHLARECHQAVGQTAAEASTTLSDEDKAKDVAALETDIREGRERLDKMGPVNVLAVEQAQEHEERHTFLTAQRQDLLDSIAELDDAVKKIDKASRDRFREAFEVINAKFGEVFKQLFGGGTAGLTLIDEEDVLESGIDVMAQPPGKRLQNVMLLSGGEKAMTAISLLFAIFQYKPSPFCILDEVDAPLDEANIGRFVRMLEGLKGHTQFVLITHSRKTMEIADQLYGVTMEEPGVSKLVSVKLS
jgi:chromosome segregation protein